MMRGCHHNPPVQAVHWLRPKVNCTTVLPHCNMLLNPLTMRQHSLTLTLPHPLEPGTTLQGRAAPEAANDQQLVVPPRERMEALPSACGEVPACQC